MTSFTNPAVNFYAHDVEKQARFYAQMFGFVETFRTPKQGRPDHIELRLGAFTIGFASVEAALRDHGLSVSADTPRAEVVLWTDDTDAAYAELAAKGVTSLMPPSDFLGSLRVAWVADPEGNPVDIVCRRTKKD